MKGIEAGRRVFFFYPPPPIHIFDYVLRSVFTSKPAPAAECGRKQGRVSYFGAENVTEAMANQLCFHSFVTGRRQRREEKVAVIKFKLPCFKLEFIQTISFGLNTYLMMGSCDVLVLVWLELRWCRYCTKKRFFFQM